MSLISVLSGLATSIVAGLIIAVPVVGVWWLWRLWRIKRKIPKEIGEKIKKLKEIEKEVQDRREKRKERIEREEFERLGVPFKLEGHGGEEPKATPRKRNPKQRVGQDSSKAIPDKPGIQISEVDSTSKPEHTTGESKSKPKSKPGESESKSKGEQRSDEDDWADFS